MLQSNAQSYKIDKLLSNQKDDHLNFDRVEVINSFFPNYFKIESYFEQISSINPTEDGSKYSSNIVFRSDIQARGDTGNILRLIFLTEPARLLTERFMSEVNDVAIAWDARGESLYGSKEALLMRRLDSYLDSNDDCNFMVRELNRYEKGYGHPSERACLEVAKKALSKNFHGIGISERLPETLFWFCSLLNWEQVPPVSADFIRKYDGLPDFQDLPMKTKKKIHKRTQLDRKIYEEAHEELDRICGKMDPRGGLSSFKKQLIFAPKWRLRENASSVLEQVADFEARLQEIKRLNDDRLVQSQEAYQSLLREHLIATNVIKPDK